MTPVPYRKRLRALGTALGRERELRGQAAWSREQLAAHQQQRLQEVVRHAASRSAFYRERLAGIDASRPVDVRDLPAVTKDELMERFDDWVTDPRLKHAEVERHLGGLRGDELLHGEYRVMATGGSTGRRGVFCYSQAEWTEFVALMLRAMRTFGIVPRLPRRRMATVMAPGPAHMTWRLGASIDVGVHKRLALAATDPVEDLVATLNAFRPDNIATFPSVAGRLADEQADGRLRIAPRIVGTSSEVRTPEMTERIRSAWRVDPHEVYGATDGLWGSTCEHRRMHFAEDQAIVEVEDDRILVTNLFLRTQPVIRYEITDLVRLDDDPCPCGRPFRTVAAIEGRSGEHGAAVAVHPMHLRSPMTRLDGVRQYQISQEGPCTSSSSRGAPATRSPARSGPRWPARSPAPASPSRACTSTSSRRSRASAGPRGSSSSCAPRRLRRPRRCSAARSRGGRASRRPAARRRGRRAGRGA